MFLRQNITAADGDAGDGKKEDEATVTSIDFDRAVKYARIMRRRRRRSLAAELVATTTVCL